MKIPLSNTRGRQGTTLVEFSVVISIGLLFLFGIFEYSRYVFMLHLANNAAREAARYASVNTNTGETEEDIKNLVQQKMSGFHHVIKNYNVEVMNVDPDTGEEIMDVDPDSGEETATSWKDSGFGDAIMVRITGEFSPVLPDFLFMGNSIPVQATAMASSEAN